MRTFTAKVPATTTADQVKQMNVTRNAQNNLAKSGGAATVPQFRTSTTTNTSIQNMASHQLTMDQNNKCRNIKTTRAEKGHEARFGG